MNLKHVTILVAVMTIMAGCKKDHVINNQVDVEVKDTIYLLNKMVTNYLLTPSPVTQTETFAYDSTRRLTKHSFNYKSYTENYTTTYSIAYIDGKVSAVNSSRTKPYPWNKINYTYSANTIKVEYTYPASKDSIIISLNSNGLANKIQGNGQYYMFTYDADGNITNRSQFENINPAKPTFKFDYLYDKKHSPFWASRDNIYIVYQAFNDINTYINNRISSNALELYNYTYYSNGYPKQMVVVHSSVAVKKVDYSYTRIILTK